MSIICTVMYRLPRLLRPQFQSGTASLSRYLNLPNRLPSSIRPFRVYAHIECEHSNADSEPQAPSSPGRGRLLSSSAATRSLCPGGRMLRLQLRAESLVHTHSKLRVAVSSGRPSTYYEISRMSSAGGWIAVYRSPPVGESVTPTWDEASIDLGSSSDLDDFRVIVAVYKIKRTECKEIGSFETTVRRLIDSRTTPARITGYSRRSLQGSEEGGDAGGRATFRLRRPAISDEVTGIISVVHAIVENANDVRDRSQRFLSSFDDSDEDDGDGECNGVSDMFGANASRIVTPPPCLPSSDARPKFVDYVRAGMVKVDFCVAVDFTSSNGDPRVPGTLHYSM